MEKKRSTNLKSCKRYANKSIMCMFAHALVYQVLAHLESGKDVRSNNWEAKEVEIINNEYFLTAKPMVYLANVSTKSYQAKGNKYLEKIAEFIKNRGNNDLLIPFSVTFEEVSIGFNMLCVYFCNNYIV